MFRQFISALMIGALINFPVHAQVKDQVSGTYTPGFYSSANYVLNPSCFANAKSSDFSLSGGTVARTTTSPLEGVASCALSGTGSGDKVKFNTKTLDNVLKNGQCEAQFWYNGDGTKWKAYVEVGTSKASADVTLIDVATTTAKQVSVIYPCGDLSLSTTVVFEATAASPATIKVGGAYVGRPINLGSKSQDTDYSLYPGSLTYAGTTATNITSQTYSQSRHGDKLTVSGTIIFNGAANANGAFRIPLPSGLAIDTAKLPFAYQNVGNADGFFNSNKHYTGFIRISNNATSYVVIHRWDDSGATDLDWGGNTSGASNVPGGVAIASGDGISFNFTVPIVGWTGQTTINAATQALQPAGEVMSYAGSSCPVGWLPADGAAVSRSTYAQLFTRIGTNHGSGDGSTTFNVPDYRGVFLRGNISIAAVTGSGSASSNNATFTAHGLRTGMPVRITSGTLSGLNTTTTYYAIKIDDNTLAFATTAANAFAGTKIAITGANSAVAQQWISPDASSRTAMQSGGNTGTNVGSVQEGQFGSHNHNYDAGANNHYVLRTTGGSLGLTTGTVQANTATGTQSSGGNETRPYNASVTYCVRAFDQATQAPILLGSVTSGSSVAERIERASIAAPTSCTVNSQSGSWISGVSGGSGACTLTVTTGYFSATPSCVCTTKPNTTANAICRLGPVSTTSVLINLYNSSSAAAINEPFDLICMGPR